MEEIPKELILHSDQTGIRFVPSSTWTMERRGERRVEMVGVNDKQQITAILCSSAAGEFLPIQLIYTGKTDRCHPRYPFPPEWNVTHSHNHWSNEDTMVQYVDNIILPYVEKVREEVDAEKVIMDNFKGHKTTKMTMQSLGRKQHSHHIDPSKHDRQTPTDGYFSQQVCEGVPEERV